MTRNTPQTPRNNVSETGQTVSVTGVRLTKGNAVDCPQIRADDGTVHTVNYLSPGVAIGDRVSVSGYHSVTLICGPVLVVENETRLGN